MSNDELKATFVIATYNRASDLERCLDSILLQQGRELEILVIDDASNDQTCEMVRNKYGGRVALISRETNCGSIKNRNHGASIAKGDILFLIDDDTELPGINTVCEVMQEFHDPRVGAVAIPYIQDGVLRQSEPADKAEEQKFVAASYVGCASAVRRDTFLSLGGYEEFFHHQVEEDDLCIRMLNSGQICRMIQISEPMMHYESPVRNFEKWDYYGRRNSILYIWKNCPGTYLLPNLLVTTIRGIFHALRIKRFRGNFAGLLGGYTSIAKSIQGRGCKRNSVRKEVYDLTLRLRRSPLPISETEHIVPPIT